MRYLMLLFALLLIGCQEASASQLLQARQPVLMLESNGWAYERSHVVQEEPGADVALSLPNLVHGSQLRAISVSYQGLKSYTEADLATLSKPILTVWAQTETEVEVPLAGAVDSGQPYTEPHWITAYVAEAGAVVDLHSYHYYIRLDGETGAGWRSGSRVLAIIVEAEPAN